MLSHRSRPAAEADVGFLADVVVEATRARGRLPADFDEPQWRDSFTEWTLEQIRAAIPGSTTSVIEIGGKPRRRKCGPSARPIPSNCAAFSCCPKVQRRGIGTAIVADLMAQAAAARASRSELSVEKRRTRTPASCITAWASSRSARTEDECPAPLRSTAVIRRRISRQVARAVPTSGSVGQERVPPVARAVREQGNQVSGVRAAPAGDRVPAGGGPVADDEAG